ncbi:MAG: hypothetical protein OHK93_000654 [Ramalina farinacea]|uniref:Uncharacterized protein n=1 Tax=Ramalina farinacea TaxID=258253 RepID=A0AA43QII1_9LECA|nr:hypothetical protein [Ramalina farinacea]
MHLHWLCNLTGLLALTSCAVAAPAQTANSPYPIDFTLYYKAIPFKDLPFNRDNLISTLNSYLLTVIYPAMIERGAGARMEPPEDAYNKDLIAIRFGASYTPHLPALSDIEIIVTGMKGAALNPRYNAVEEANIVVFKGGVSRNVVAGISLTVFPVASNSSLSDTGSSAVDVA